MGARKEWGSGHEHIHLSPRMKHGNCSPPSPARSPGPRPLAFPWPVVFPCLLRLLRWGMKVDLPIEKKGAGGGVGGRGGGGEEVGGEKGKRVC